MRGSAAPAALLIATALLAGCTQSNVAVDTGPGRSVVATDPVTTDSVFAALEAGGPTEVVRLFGPPTLTLTGVYDLETGEPGGASLDVSDGKTYVVNWGIDSKGVPVVSEHYIVPSSEATLTSQDRQFVSLLIDGRTSVEQANQKLAAFMPKSWEPLDPMPEGPKSKLLVWELPSGGFVIDDFSGMSKADAKRLELDQVGSPYGVLVWDANHLESD